MLAFWIKVESLGFAESLYCVRWERKMVIKIYTKAFDVSNYKYTYSLYYGEQDHRRAKIWWKCQELSFVHVRVWVLIRHPSRGVK